MPLVIRDVEDTDFEQWTAMDDSSGNGLVAPALLLTWAPCEERQCWSLKQQHDIFTTDPTVKFLKVVDTELGNGKGEAIALARWHFYKNGYQHPQMTSLELKGSASEETPYPRGLDSKLFEAILLPIFEARQHWMGHEPQWVLSTLVTRASHRRRGAGGMLVNWGVERARRDCVPAYIEASVEGKSLYEKYGFKEAGTIQYDASQFAGLDSVVIAKMVCSHKLD